MDMGMGLIQFVALRSLSKLVMVNLKAIRKQSQLAVCHIQASAGQAPLSFFPSLFQRIAQTVFSKIADPLSSRKMLRRMPGKFRLGSKLFWIQILQLTTGHGKLNFLIKRFSGQV